MKEPLFNSCQVQLSLENWFSYKKAKKLQLSTSTLAGERLGTEMIVEVRMVKAGGDKT